MRAQVINNITGLQKCLRDNLLLGFVPAKPTTVVVRSNDPLEAMPGTTKNWYDSVLRNQPQRQSHQLAQQCIAGKVAPAATFSLHMGTLHCDRRFPGNCLHSVAELPASEARQQRSGICLDGMSLGIQLGPGTPLIAAIPEPSSATSATIRRQSCPTNAPSLTSSACSCAGRLGGRPVRGPVGPFRAPPSRMPKQQPGSQPPVSSSL